MNITRSDLDAPIKLVGFVVGTVLLFFVALFVGDTIGPEASDTGESSPAVHDSHNGAAWNGHGHSVEPTAGTYALYLDFQHGGVVHTAESTIEVPEGQA